jgi:hypothetical protein
MEENIRVLRVRGPPKGSKSTSTLPEEQVLAPHGERLLSGMKDSERAQIIT